MALEFINPRPTTPQSVGALESRLGTQLPRSFRNLLVEVSNGGVVEPVVANSDPSIGVVAVLGAARGDALDIEDRLAQLRNGRLVAGLIPIMDAEGGNLVCLSVRQVDFGTIWFWDHERELEGDAATMTAPSFDAFVDDLSPLAAAESLPTVDEVWIDPVFLTEIENEPKGDY